MKKALLIGIDYDNKPYALNGCLNDVNEIYKVSLSVFDEIDVLLENSATKSAILSKFTKLVSEANKGDVIYFHYSGHGSQVPDDNGDELDRLDEVLIPYDIDDEKFVNVIRDDELASIIDQNLKEGVNLTITLDCCNSGSGTRKIVLGNKRLLKNPNIVARRTPVVSNLKSLLNDRKEILLSACESDQQAYETVTDGGVKMGAFTKVLVDLFL